MIENAQVFLAKKDTVYYKQEMAQVADAWSPTRCSLVVTACPCIEIRVQKGHHAICCKKRLLVESC